MVRVAVAGGTGGLGRTLVEELMKGSDHEVFILSRKSTLAFSVPSNVHLLTPTYDNVDSLQSLLTTHLIHTLISVLNPPTPETHATELNLIAAAALSPTVQRFIPSEWGVPFTYPDSHLPLPGPWKDLKLEAQSALRAHALAGKLEYTLVHNGFFMDYFGLPHADSYMSPEVPFIDIQACKAAIPGSGDENGVVFTYTRDVARFVRRLVEESGRWEERSVVVGDKVTMNEVLEAAEKARGQKFDTTHDSLADLRAGNITEIPAYIPAYEYLPKEFLLGMMAAFGIGMITGVFDLGEDTLNKRYPDVETVKVGEFIERYWKGK